MLKLKMCSGLRQVIAKAPSKAIKTSTPTVRKPFDDDQRHGRESRNRGRCVWQGRNTETTAATWTASAEEFKQESAKRPDAGCLSYWRKVETRAPTRRYIALNIRGNSCSCLKWCIRRRELLHNSSVTLCLMSR